MKPSATHKWLFAAVNAVLWAIATTALWAILALALGRSKSDVRLLTVLVIGAVFVALLGARAYSAGWTAGSKASRALSKETKPLR